MPTNDFLPVAGGAGANVKTQAAYLALLSTFLANGFASGVVDSPTFNKALRQASAIAAGVAQYVADLSGDNVLDDGNSANLLASIKKAIAAQIDAQSGNYALDTGSANASVVTISPPVTVYPPGMTVRFRKAVTNTGACTLDAGAGPLPLNNDLNGALLANDAPAGSVVAASFDATANTWLINSLVPSQALSQAAADARYIAIGAGPIQGAFRNLAGSAPGTSAVVTYTIGELVTGDGAGNYQTTRAWNNTLAMTSAGAGGLDTGAVAASTWYYVFGITKPDGTKALLASLSATAPLLPSGYTKWARIGAIITDGTANKYPLTFQQYGRNVQYKLVAGTNLTLLPTIAAGVQGAVGTTLVSAAIGFFVPPTACRIRGTIYNGGNGTTQISPNSIATSSGGSSVTAATSTGGPTTSFDFILESTNLWYASNAAGSAAYCLGWEDNI